MKGTISGVWGLVGVLLSAGLVQAQTPPSLADLARAEQARRRALPEKSRVYTNDDVRDVRPLTMMGQEKAAPAAVESGAEGDAGTGAAGGPAGGQAAGGTGPGVKGTEVGGAGEDQWRQRITAAREQLSRARIQLDAMRTRAGNLAAAGLTASESEVGRVQALQKETLQEYDRLRADVVRFEQAIAEIEAQARQAGVPPGWLR